MREIDPTYIFDVSFGWIINIPYIIKVSGTTFSVLFRKEHPSNCYQITETFSNLTKERVNGHFAALFAITTINV